MDIKIKYLRDINELKILPQGDWIDLRAAETVEVKKDSHAVIPLGIAMELPKGYEALILPRSSTYKKYKIIFTNSMGIIDESYCGDTDEWFLTCYATEDTVIPKNERIAQFRIIEHQPSVTLKKVDTLGNEARGGFGSTGRR